MDEDDQQDILLDRVQQQNIQENVQLIIHREHYEKQIDSIVIYQCAYLL